VAVTNRDDFLFTLFTLVPQRDRRQHPDRRAIWRGSRRAADHVAAPSGAHAPTAALWTPLESSDFAVIEKRFLH
jgi:hypothetical protein